jgi:preprotein translocase subunit SecB
MEKRYKSVLKLSKLIFEKIEFERLGTEKSQNDIQFGLNVQIGENAAYHRYKVTLDLHGEKKNEYTVQLVLTGYFDFEGQDDTVTDELRDELIKSNTVAIMMPYLRSELSLLTAQPNVDCVVLPPLNVVQMMKDEEK